MNDTTTKRLNWLNTIIHVSIATIILTIPFDHTNTIRNISVVAALLAWLAKKCLLRKWKIIKIPLQFPLLALFGAILLSTFTSLDTLLTIKTLKSQFVTYTLLYILIVDNITRRQDIWSLSRMFLIGNLIAIALYGFLFISKGINFDAWLQCIYSSYLTRGMPHMSTYFLSSFLFIYVGINYTKSFRKWHFLLLPCLFLINAGFLLSCNQRAAIVGAYIGMIAYPILVKANRKRAIVISVGIPVLIGLFVALTPLRQALVHEDWSLVKRGEFNNKYVDEDTTQERYQIYKFWMAYLTEHPFDGVGYGRNNMKSVYVTHGHNAFLNIAVQTGIQGLVAILAIIVLQIKYLYMGLRLARRHWDRFMLVGTTIYIIGFWMRNQFDDVFRHSTAICYWIIAGLSMALYMIIERENNLSKRNIITSGGPDGKEAASTLSAPDVSSTRPDSASTKSAGYNINLYTS